MRLPRPSTVVAALCGAVTASAVVATVASRADQPAPERRTIPYGGYVDFDGSPVNAASVAFNFALFACPTPGPGVGQCPNLWVARGTWNDAATSLTLGWPTGASDRVTVPVLAGRFAVELGEGAQNALPDAVFATGHEVLYLAIQVEGHGLGALQKVVPTPRARVAEGADRFRVRSDLQLDEAVAGHGAAALSADSGLVVSHTDPALPPDAPLFRTDYGDTSQLTVTAGAGVTVADSLSVGGALAVSGDLAAQGTVCDGHGCLETRKVMWHAYNKANSSFSGGQRLIYSDTMVNIGGAYDTSSGIATVPVAGVYRLCAYTITQGTVGSVFMDLHVNDQDTQGQGGRVYAANVTEGQVLNLAGCALRQLAAGDKVEWIAPNLGVYPSGSHSWMTGELL